MIEILLVAWLNVVDEWPGITLPQMHWFKEQRATNGDFCCDKADGHPAAWRIRSDHYEAWWDGDWRPIPPDKVLEHGNALDVAVLWLMNGTNSEGIHGVRCFAPGPGA